jgi:hypothetical protein
VVVVVEPGSVVDVVDVLVVVELGTGLGAVIVVVERGTLVDGVGLPPVTRIGVV